MKQKNPKSFRALCGSGAPQAQEAGSLPVSCWNLHTHTQRAAEVKHSCFVAPRQALSRNRGGSPLRLILQGQMQSVLSCRLHPTLALHRRKHVTEKNSPHRPCVVVRCAAGAGSDPPTVVARWSLDAKFGCKTETISLVRRRSPQKTGTASLFPSPHAQPPGTAAQSRRPGPADSRRITPPLLPFPSAAEGVGVDGRQRRRHARR